MNTQDKDKLANDLWDELAIPAIGSFFSRLFSPAERVAPVQSGTATYPQDTH
jgi:hypothetical protein